MENELFEEAKNLYINQEFKEAINKFQECINQNLFVSQCYEYIAKAYYSLKDTNRAEENFRFAISTDQNNLSALYSFGIIEITFAQYKEAYNVFKRLLDYDKTKVAINVGYAASLLGMRKVKEAKKVILNAIKYDKDINGEDAKPNLMCYQIYLVILNEIGDHQKVIQTIEDGLGETI